MSNPNAVGVLLNETSIANIPWTKPPVVNAGVTLINGGGGDGFVSTQVHLLAAYLASSKTL